MPDMLSHLKKAFIFQIVLYFLLLLVLLSFIFILINNHEVEQRVNTEFKGEVSLMAQRIISDHRIAAQKVRALESRSAIKQKMCDYLDGNISLNEMKGFVGTKYFDGARVYENVVWVRRTATDGELVAEIVFSDVSFLENPEILPPFLEYKGYRYHFIKNPVTSGDRLLGYDYALFFFDSSLQLRSGLVAASSIKLKDALEHKKSSYAVPLGDTSYFFEAELDRAKVKKEKMKRAKTIFFLVLPTLFVIFLLTYFAILRMSYSAINKLDIANSQLSKNVEDRELLLRELHHRIKNNLSLVISFVELQSMKTDNSEIQEQNKNIVSKMRAISLVHEKLQLSDTLKNLDLCFYIRELGNELIKNSGEKNVRLDTKFPDELIRPSNDVMNIGLVFSELVINSLKHALGESGLIITVEILQREDGFAFSYMDNGKPYPAGFDFNRTNSLGSQVLSSLVEKMGGLLEYDFDNSKEVTLLFLDGSNNVN